MVVVMAIGGEKKSPGSRRDRGGVSGLLAAMARSSAHASSSVRLSRERSGRHSHGHSHGHSHCHSHHSHHSHGHRHDRSHEGQQKSPGHGGRPARSLFSTLFYVAARGGK